jgi:hypothetical protein
MTEQCVLNELIVLLENGDRWLLEDICKVTSFEDACIQCGPITSLNKGIILTMQDGSEFHLTLTRTK